MESITCGGVTFQVKEIARPPGKACRLLASVSGEMFLEYLVPVGPYHIDISVVHAMTLQQRKAYQEGELDLGSLANRLAEEDIQSKKYER